MFGTVYITVREFTDEAGSPDTDHEQVELCVLCLAKELAAFLAPAPLAWRQEWLARIGGKPR